MEQKKNHNHHYPKIHIRQQKKKNLKIQKKTRKRNDFAGSSLLSYTIDTINTHTHTHNTHREKGTSNKKKIGTKLKLDHDDWTPDCIFHIYRMNIYVQNQNLSSK